MLPTYYMYLWIRGLRNDSISSSDYIASNDRTVYEREKTWKEVVVA
jgi:hypothetical protein